MQSAPVEELTVPVSGVGLDVENNPTGGAGRYPLDDPFFPGLLLSDEIAPGFELGDTSLSDRAEEDADAVPISDGSEISTDQSGMGAGEGEAVDAVGGPRVFRGLNTLGVAPGSGRIVRRTAMNQALSTGDVILGNLGGLRGSLASPFLPRRRFDVPALRLGIIDIRPSATAGLVVGHYSGNGVEGDEDQVGGFFQAEISAALRETRNLMAVLDYTIGVSTPTGRFSNNGNGDDVYVDQYFTLDSEFSLPQFPKTRFGLELEYAGLSGVDRDVGTDASRMLATGTFMATYTYSPKTTIDWDISVPVREFRDEISSGGVTTSLFVNNQVTRKTELGLGVAVGTLKVEGNSSQWFQQLLFRVNHRPSRLWSLDAIFGLELREDGGSPDFNPIFGLGFAWEPWDGTSVLLAAESRIFNSAALVSANYRSTSVNVSVQQRLGYRLSTSLSLGYENAVYDRVPLDGVERRRDNLYEASVGLHMPITRRWSWDLIFSAGKNDSNFAPFEFLQGVLQTSYQF